MNIKVVYILLLITITGCNKKNDNQNHPNDDMIGTLEKAAWDNLYNKWYPLVLDTIDGGYYSDVTFDFKIGERQNKMLVTQARHVWVNSKAAILNPNNKAHLKYAKHGFEFLKNYMWDKQYGGFHTLVTKTGEPLNRTEDAKTAYGNSFAIYGLATYYAASGNEEALEYAKKTFNWLETHSHDPEYKGYFQSLQVDGTPLLRTENTPLLSTIGFKDQNSSIHLLEAITALYEVWPDELVKERLEELLLLIRDTITTDKGYMNLYFEKNWTPISFKNTSKENIQKHYNLDHVSFGHDIETAYLMLEASHALGWKNDTITLLKSKKMVDHTIKTGWDKNLGGLYDGGYYFDGTDSITIVNNEKNWWSQAEGLNSLLMMANYFPEDKLNYRLYADKLWAYINKYIMDAEHGGWYEWGTDKRPESKTALKGHIWKSTYHNFRALTNSIEHLKASTEKEYIFIVGELDFL